MNTTSLPFSEPKDFSFQMCKRYIDHIALVTDEELVYAMQILFEHLKLAVEPAGAAATAALIGPLREKCTHKKVGVIVCGSNIDVSSHARMLKV